jgi:hypothetical protein
MHSPLTDKSYPFHLLDWQKFYHDRVSRLNKAYPLSQYSTDTTKLIERMTPMDNQPGGNLQRTSCKPNIVLRQTPIKTPHNNSARRKTQLTLDDSLSKKRSHYSQHQGVWGHYPVVINEKETLRILLNNPHGLKLGQDIQSTTYSLQVTEALGVGVLCIAETNVNWDHNGTHSKVQRVMRSVWENIAITTSYIKDQFKSEVQPGRTMTLVTNDWNSRIIERGTDPFGLGRWTYFSLRGKGKIKVMIVTAYRVSQEYLSSVGQKTAAMQQFRHLSQQNREAGMISDPKPKYQFIIDLQAWLQEMMSKEYEIILCLDANESIDSKVGQFSPLQYSLSKPITGSGHDGTLATLIRTCGLCDPLTIQHHGEPPPATYKRG